MESGQETDGITLTEYELRRMIRNEMDQYFSNINSTIVYIL